MNFLSAEWRRLAIANYAIDPKLLKDYIPKHTELDLWNGVCYVSVVGFMFVNTRVLGLKVPFHSTFEEVNLRFYVKHFDGDTWKRGVVFIKEIVPRLAVTFVANTLYKEHYQTLKMKHLWLETDHELITQYEWKCENQWQSMLVKSDKTPLTLPENSEEEFITQHFWGYSKRNEQTTFEYEVTHPRWAIYNVNDYEINIDFDRSYGTQFALLNDADPKSVMLAEGSAITVKGKRRL